LLGLIAALGILSLGLVVVNIGALYRLRYAFLILLIIMAAGGVTQILERFNLPASLNKPAKAIDSITPAT
jgi:predicted lipid-binding transport protein (Tim44 family)